MSSLDFNTHINNIRREALISGFSISTMNNYFKTWNKFISWKNQNCFVYNSNDYSIFLLDVYHFDINNYNLKKISSFQKHLIYSKDILDNFELYKKRMTKQLLPNALYNVYPNSWNLILDNYLKYLKNTRYLVDNSIKLQQRYLIRVFAYFYQNNINFLKDITKNNIIDFINKSINAGNRSKSRYFYILRCFLNYLFIENILIEDLSKYIPTCKRQSNKKVPTYLKSVEIETLLSSIPKTSKVEIRDYCIILIAARLGLRISDILNIKLKDINWKNNKFKVIQPKTNNFNVLPLSNEVGWAIINYLKNSRPKCNNKFLFVKMKYPFDKMEYFNKFNKYFDKINIKLKDNNKKGIHNLRHSMATNLLTQETPINIIANILGNSSEVTSNTYLKLDKKNLQTCILEVPNEL